MSNSFFPRSMCRDQMRIRRVDGVSSMLQFLAPNVGFDLLRNGMVSDPAHR
jgi:hypothetical protein